MSEKSSGRTNRTKRSALIASVVALGVYGALATLVGCDSGDVQCTQPCEQSSECKGDMLCLNSARGFMCLPHECDPCFEAGRTCSYSTAGSLGDKTFVCSSPYCS